MRVFASAAVLLLCAACSGGAPGPTDTLPASTPTVAATSTEQASTAPSTTPPGASESPPATSPPPAAAWDWPLDGDDDISEGGEPTSGEPDGIELPAGPDEAATEPTENEEEGAIDPCSLITTQDWFDFAQLLPAAAMLEDGEACGWQNNDDDLRLALGVFNASSVGRYLPEDQRAAGTSVPDLGDQATWIEQWPIPQSSTLVIEVGALDVVLEVSARGEVWPAQMQSVALHFAALVLARLPS
jgi:hypothetical protein